MELDVVESQIAYLCEVTTLYVLANMCLHFKVLSKTLGHGASLVAKRTLSTILQY